MDKEKQCFVIAPIGDQNSETRKRSDKVLKHIIGPAAAICGYSSVRADQISEPGLITSQVIQHILEDPLVIADLTGRNPNVFYELALRHAIKKPLVQLINRGEAIPFDVAGMRTIQMDHTDLDSAHAAKEEIVAQIKSVEKKRPEEIESPVSFSLQLQKLRESDKPEQRTLAELVSAVSEIRASLATMDQQRSTTKQFGTSAVDFLRESGKFYRVKNNVTRVLGREMGAIKKKLLTLGLQKKDTGEYQFLEGMFQMLKQSLDYETQRQLIIADLDLKENED